MDNGCEITKYVGSSLEFIENECVIFWNEMYPTSYQRKLNCYVCLGFDEGYWGCMQDGLDLTLICLSIFLQTTTGTLHHSPHRHPTYTLLPSRGRQVPISPSISRLARPTVSFWRTWATQTSFGWSWNVRYFLSLSPWLFIQPSVHFNGLIILIALYTTHHHTHWLTCTHTPGLTWTHGLMISPTHTQESVAFLITVRYFGWLQERAIIWLR